MTASRRDRRDWRTFRVVLVVTSIISAVFSYFNRDPEGTAWRSVPEGIAVALAIATPIMMFELRADRIDRLKRLRRLPLAIYFAIKLVFYMVVIVSALLVMRFVFTPDLEHLGRFDAIFRRSLIFAIGMSFLVNLIFEIGTLIGFGTLKNLLTGR
jgi:adenylate cyclase